MKITRQSLHKLIPVCLFLVTGLLHAQTIVEIPSGNPVGSGNPGTASLRKPFGSTRSFERSAMIYKQAELGGPGIITSLGFFLDSLNTPGDAPVRIFLKETADTSMPVTTVAAVQAGATLVYEDTLLAATLADSQWVNVTLTNPFPLYSGLNLMVIVETNSGGANGTDVFTVSKGFRFFSTSTANFQYWQSPANNSNPPTGNGTISIFRPNMRVEMSPPLSCTTPPIGGIALASEDTVCPGSTVNFTIQGNSTGFGISYQWIASSDGITWQDVAGANQSVLTATLSTDSAFACVITCSGSSDTTAFAQVVMKNFLACYCVAGIGGGCVTQPSAIDSVAIATTPFAVGPTGCAPGFYTQYPDTGSATVSLTQGQLYSMSIRYTGNCRSSLWIDYNQNGVYETSEWTQLNTTSVAGTLQNATFQVPITALTGQTGMRIRSRVTAGVNDSLSACTAFGTGETEDFIITIVNALNCVSPPNAGTSVATQDTVCSGEAVSFSLAGSSSGIGITYQWIASADGTNWSDLAGATNPILSIQAFGDSAYACVVTCSGVSDTSSAVSVVVKPFFLCYCTQGIGGDCNANPTAIDSVAIDQSTLVNGPSGCSPTFYASYPVSLPFTGDLIQGGTHTLITRYTGTSRAAVWIDYDQSGTFDADEWTEITTGTPGATDVFTPLQVPVGALTGPTGMRIRSRAVAGTTNSNEACATFGSGETEDYVVNIVLPPTCTSPPIAGLAIASEDTLCSGESVILTLTNTPFALGQGYQWIASSDGITWTAMPGDTLPAVTAVITSDSLFACVLICSGQSDTSNAVQVLLSNFMDCYCTLGLGGGCVTQPSAIDSLAITGTGFQNGPTGCAASFYTLYPAAAPTTATLNQGASYQLASRFSGNCRAVIWIDYDQNGVFDSWEGTQICTTSVAGIEVLSTFTVPANALTGLTMMRVRSRVTAGLNDSTAACLTFGTGETEDYQVLIDLPLAGRNPSKPSDLFIVPNPNNGSFSVSHPEGIVAISVFETSGRLIHSRQFESNRVQIDIRQELPPGMYLITTLNAYGKQSHARFVVR